MKLRVIDRLLAALAGLILIALAVIPVADTLFGTGILVWLNKVAEFKNTPHLLFMLGGGALLLVIGLLLLRLAVRRVKRKGFVVQTTDVGELSISIRAIEDLVNKCVEKHEEVHVSSKALENTRDGLVINLRVGLATGVNIPLAVSALQKQIKQYVTACSGVDVSEVKVQVDATSTKAKPSIYAVSEVLENAQPLPREEETVPEKEEEPVAGEVKEPEEKCLHQRLFGEEEQPAIVPEPPVAEEIAEAEEAAEPEATAEAVEEQNIPTDEETEAWEENVPADESVEAWEKKLPADEVIEAWEKAEEEAAEAAAALTELDTLAGLTDEEELPEEPEESVTDEESIAELEALDGAEDMNEEAEKPAVESAEDPQKEEEA